jgi:hypothetical protein
MHLSSYAHTQHAIPDIAPNTGSNFDVVVQRAFSRMKTIFMSFSKCPLRRRAVSSRITRPSSRRTAAANHDEPLGTPFAYDFSADQMTYHIAVGPILYPQLPCRGHAEAYVQLSKCLAMDSQRRWTVLPAHGVLPRPLPARRLLREGHRHARVRADGIHRSFYTPNGRQRSIFLR